MSEKTSPVERTTSSQRDKNHLQNQQILPSPVLYTPTHPAFPFKVQLPIRVYCSGILDVRCTLTVNTTPPKLPSDFNIPEQVQKGLKCFVLSTFHHFGYVDEHDFVRIERVKGVWRDAREKVFGVEDHVLLEDLVVSGGALDATVTIGIEVAGKLKGTEGSTTADEDGAEGKSHLAAVARNKFWE